MASAPPGTLPRHLIPEVAHPLMDLNDLSSKLAEYVQADMEVKRVQKRAQKPWEPREPKFPEAPPHWEAVGKVLGMPGPEVAIIMEAVLQDPTNELVIESVRQLILVGKLTVGGQIQEYRSNVVATKRKYESDKQSYERDLERYEHNLGIMDSLKGQRDTLFKDLWTKVVDELQAACVVADHRMRRLHATIHAMMMVMNNNSRYVVLDRTVEDDWLVNVNWPMIYKFKGPHIDTILTTFSKMKVFTSCQSSTSSSASPTDCTSKTP